MVPWVASLVYMPPYTPWVYTTLCTPPCYTTLGIPPLYPGMLAYSAAPSGGEETRPWAQPWE